MLQYPICIAGVKEAVRPAEMRSIAFLELQWKAADGMASPCLLDQGRALVHTNGEPAGSDELCHLPKIVTTSTPEIERELAGFELEEREGKPFYRTKTRRR